MSRSSSSSPRIVVVGGGIVGLTSALALLQRGFRDVRVVAESFDDLVSHVAGAIWMPFALPADIDPYQTTKWCEASMAWLDGLYKKHGDAVGIHFVKGHDVMADGVPDVAHPYWAHCVKDYRLLTREEANAVCPGMTHGASFETIIYKPAVLMAFLREKITKLGGTFETRRVENTDAITDCDLLVNCTGLGARDFAQDESVHPVRGQVIRIHNPSIKQFTMIIHRDGSHTYVLPRPHGEIVVGGTVQPHNWKRENDEEDLKGVWDRACAAVPAVAGSKILGRHCGLRPARSLGVRLEVDPKRTANGAVVVHNYGHAGSGHTLQWGCALDVAKLATQYLGVPAQRSRI